VEIHPPRLETAGLEPVLGDLLSPLAASGVATELQVDDGAASGSPADPLIYRVAREALRNVAEHAEATTVSVEVTRGAGAVTLTVADNGRGFDGARRAQRAGGGHVGLTLLEDLVTEAGGTLDVRSAPGTGTTVVLEVPVT
jgi:signal transduction histidine kinase